MSYDARLAAILSLAASCLLAQDPRPPALVEMYFPTTQSPIIYGINSAENRAPVRSTDNGVSWTPLYIFPAGTIQNVTSLALQSGTTQVVFASVSLNRGGVWKSTDGGQRWSQANSGLPAGNLPVENLTTSLSNPQVLYVRIADGVYKSSDAGSAWVRTGTLPNTTTAFGLGRVQPTVMYVMQRGGYMMRSNDEGATWQEVTRVGAYRERVGITIDLDPGRPEWAYVRSEAPPENTGRCDTPGGGLWQTRDGGGTWIQVFSSGSCTSSPSVIVDPFRPWLHLRTGLIGQAYCKSTNAGDTFVCAKPVLGNPNLNVVALDPRNTVVLYGASGAGVSNDGGETWVPTNSQVRVSLPFFDTPLRFEIEQGTTVTQSVPILTPEGNYRIPFTASIAGRPWITLLRTLGSTTESIDLRLSAENLAPGVYTTTLRLDALEAFNGSTTSGIEMVVRPKLSPAVRHTYTTFGGGATNLGKPLEENVPAAQARITAPQYLARDGAGSIYFLTENRIRKVNAQGILSTVAGTGVRGSAPDGTHVAQAMLDVTGLAADRQGTIYFAEASSNRVRVIRGNFIDTVLSPSVRFGNVAFGGPRQIHVDSQDRLYVPSTPGIVRVSPQGAMELIYTPPQSVVVSDIASAPNGVLYFLDSVNHRVWRYSGINLQLFAGTGTAGYNGDGRPAIEAQLNSPRGIDVDVDGNVYVGDRGNRRVRMIRTDGFIFTIGGNGQAVNVFDPTGAVATEVAIIPEDVLAETDGSLLVADAGGILRLAASRITPPEITDRSMTNAASGGPQLSPGSLFSLYGLGLAARTVEAPGAPWPTELGGAVVLINGRSAPLYYTLVESAGVPGQINGQVPYETGLGNATLEIRRGGVPGRIIQFPIVPAAPGILMFGAGRAVAQNEGAILNTSESPAAQESIIVIYFTGTGPLDNAVATGAAAPLSPFSRATLAASVTAGGREGTIEFIGLAPFYVGLGQLNVKLPPLDSGDHAVVLTINGVASNQAIISVR